eukprot:1709644-Amphidinium_carterae.1
MPFMPLYGWAREQPTAALSSAEAGLAAWNTWIHDSDLEAQQLKHLIDVLEQAKVKHLHIKHLHSQDFLQEQGHSLKSERRSEPGRYADQVTLKTLQILRPILGLTAFGTEAATTGVNAVSATSGRKIDQKLMARALAKRVNNTMKMDQFSN